MGLKKVVKLLKDENRKALYAALALNVAVFLAAVQSDAILGGDLLPLVRSAIASLPAVVSLILITIVNGLISADMKARLVFLRWDNPLPGSQAFSRYGPADPRVNFAEIKRLYGPLPTDPVEQNRLWYKMSLSVEGNARVKHAHREFLLARDYAPMALMLLIGLGAAGFFTIPSTGTAVIYAGLLLIQFAATIIAGQNYGRRFVTSVLAIKAGAPEAVKPPRKAVAAKG